MKHFLLNVLIYLSVGVGFAQTPVLKWDKTFGIGGVIKAVPAKDGGYLLAGRSSANAGFDKTENGRGGVDYWIIKIDKSGNKQWDKTFGGTAEDLLTVAASTSDGGYILAGNSKSGSGGDKTEPFKPGTQTPQDIWIVKVDSLGNKQWDRTIGTSAPDAIIGIHEAVGGGYLLVAPTSGPPSGDKTASSFGGDFYVEEWIVKLAPNGLKLWDKIVGTGTLCRPVASQILSDGGLLISNVQDYENHDDRFNMMRVDAQGNKMWYRSLGGDLLAECIDIKQSIDGGFILGGYITGWASGDQSQDASGTDYWIVKTDSALNKTWDRVLGSIDTGADENPVGYDYLYSLIETPDKGVLGIGITTSVDAGKDKTEPGYGGDSDIWLIRLDSTGATKWDKTIGGTGHESAVSIVRASDGGYVLTGNSNSPKNIFKSEDPKGANDIWVFKLLEEQQSLPQTTIRINAGGPDFTTATKKLFIADKYYADIDRTSSIASGDILNTTNDVLYRSGRSSPSFSYNIPVVNGQVNVTLHFAETYFGAPGKKGGAGSRRFHINMEGSRKLTNYDIFAAAGGALRAVQTTIPVTVSDGVLNIDFLTGAADQPRVCAIEVVATGLTLSPIADAYVRDGSYKSTNFGSNANLEIKYMSADLAVRRASYLKFQLPTQTPVTSAKLRVYGHNHENTKPVSVHAYGVNNDSWTESEITKSNAPTASTASLGFAAVNEIYKYYEIDVTSFVKAQQQSGETLVSLLLNDPNSRNTRLIFNSKEAGSNPPQLLIQTTNSGARLGEKEVLEEVLQKQSSTVFPNPVKDHFTVSISPEHVGPVTFEMLNAAGSTRSVLAPQNAKPGENIEVNIAEHSFDTGIYLLKIKSTVLTEVVKVLIAD